MPFGAWTEEDWRLRDRRQPGPYLIHDEASTPSDVLLQAKAEARRMRSTISLSKASLPGKALSRGGPSLGSTHFSSRMHNSSTSIGELQESVDTVQTLVSPFSSVDDDSELLLEHSEMILQHWKKEGQPKLWLVDKILGSPKSDASLTFDAGVDHTLTSASMDLFKVENDAYGTGAPKHEEEEEKFTVGDAVQLIAGGTVIGAVAEDMLRKLKNTGPRSGLSRSYIETCERFGKLADKVKEVFEQMEEIAKFEVEKANLRVKLRAGDVNPAAMATALGREGDQELIAKISAASEQDEDDDQIDGKEKLISEIETMLSRNDLAILLKEVLGVLETFKWQDMATEFRKWIFQSDNSENVVRRVIDESVELHRDAIGVLTLSKFLADETLSSHSLLAARNLADFHEAIDREMKLMLEKCGLDDSITLRKSTGAAPTAPSTPDSTRVVRTSPSTPSPSRPCDRDSQVPAVRKSTGAAPTAPSTPDSTRVVRNMPRVEAPPRPSEPASHAPVVRNLPPSSLQRIGVSVPRVDSPPRLTEPESHVPIVRNLPPSSPQRIGVAAASPAGDVQVPLVRNVPAISPQRMDPAPAAEQDVHVPVVRNLPPSTPQRIGVASSPSGEHEDEKPAVRKLPPSFPQRIQSSPIPAESPPVSTLPPSSPRSRAADDEAPISRNVNPNWSPIPAESPPVRTVPPELPRATEGIFARPQDRVRPGTTATADSDESERTDPFAAVPAVPAVPAMPAVPARPEVPIQATPAASSGSPPASPSMSPLQRSRSADEVTAQRSFTEKCHIS